MTDAWLSRVGTVHEPQGKACSKETGRKRHGGQDQERSLGLLTPQACKHHLPIRGIRALRKPREAGRGES